MVTRIFIDFDRKMVASLESLFEQVIEDEDFYAFCADNFEDYIEDLSDESKSIVEGLDEEELIYDFLPDDVRCEFENLLFEDWVDDNYQIYDFDEYGYPVH